jgi:hypothetical protein
MDILNLGGINEPSERPSKKKLKVIIGIGLLAGVMGMGSTLAASITLNGGTAVEFGQGVQLVTACDSAITVTPTSVFENDSRTGQANFRLGTIKLSSVDNINCLGKKIRLTAYTDSDSFTAYTLSGDATTSPLAFAHTYTNGNIFGGSAAGGSAKMAGCELTLATTGSDPAEGTTISCTLNGSTSVANVAAVSTEVDNEILITFTSATSGSSVTRPVLAAAISKFALESNA